MCHNHEKCVECSRIKLKRHLRILHRTWFCLSSFPELCGLDVG
ncbi:unnamed protein product, partial [Larinioides sclopetarius]